VPIESDLEYRKRHGFDKLEERENAKQVGIDPNASSTTKDGSPAKEKTKKQSDRVKGKTKKQFDADDEAILSSGSSSDSFEGSYKGGEVTGSDGSDSDDYESSGADSEASGDDSESSGEE